MAIIDTSKGVRPCVEELSRLAEIKNVLDSTNLDPVFDYIKHPELFRPDFSVPTFGWINNHDSSFSISLNNAPTTTTAYYTELLPIELQWFEDTAAPNYLISEPFAIVMYQNNYIDNSIRMLNGYINHQYVDKDGTARSLGSMFTRYNYMRFSINKEQLPFTNFKLRLGVRPATVVSSTEPILYYCNMYRLLDTGLSYEELLPIIRNYKTLPYLGFFERSNQTMYENYLAAHRVATDTLSNGLKYYHDAE